MSKKNKSSRQKPKPPKPPKTNFLKLSPESQLVAIESMRNDGGVIQTITEDVTDHIQYYLDGLFLDKQELNWRIHQLIEDFDKTPFYAFLMLNSKGEKPVARIVSISVDADNIHDTRKIFSLVYGKSAPDIIKTHTAYGLTVRESDIAVWFRRKPDPIVKEKILSDLNKWFIEINLIVKEKISKKIDELWSEENIIQLMERMAVKFNEDGTLVKPLSPVW